MGEYSLTKSERLCREKTISRLFTEGRSGFAYPFRYYWRQEESTDEGAAPVAVLFTVPKKMFKRAVKRNLLKRRSREAYRLNKGILTAAAAEKGKRVELALVYTDRAEADFKKIENGVKRILDQISKSL